MLPLILYDIPSKLPGNNWSPNPAKPRFVLSYKKLPFETVWIEYPDIAPMLKELGATPNKRPDGSEQYTVPVLSDPNTGALVTDSWVIAEYLEKTYPEKPIFPNNSAGVINAFEAVVSELWGTSFERLTLLRTSQILNERSAEYFIRTREQALGAKVDDWSPEGPTRNGDWAVVKKGYDTTKMWYDKVDGKWLMGDTFSYADIVVACRILWSKRVYQDAEWKEIRSWHDGKWEELLANVEKECNLA